MFYPGQSGTGDERWRRHVCDKRWITMAANSDELTFTWIDEGAAKQAVNALEMAAQAHLICKGVERKNKTKKSNF